MHDLGTEVLAFNDYCDRSCHDIQAIHRKITEWVDEAVKSCSQGLTVVRYGSYSCGLSTPKSDLDLVVVPSESRYTWGVVSVTAELMLALQKASGMSEYPATCFPASSELGGEARRVVANVAEAMPSLEEAILAKGLKSLGRRSVSHLGEASEGAPAAGPPLPDWMRRWAVAQNKTNQPQSPSLFQPPSYRSNLSEESNSRLSPVEKGPRPWDQPKTPPPKKLADENLGKNLFGEFIKGLRGAISEKMKKIV